VVADGSCGRDFDESRSKTVGRLAREGVETLGGEKERGQGRGGCLYRGFTEDVQLANSMHLYRKKDSFLRLASTISHVPMAAKPGEINF